jgi:hypothetical protein
MKTHILLFTISFLYLDSTKSQTVEWLNIFERNSFGNCIEETNDGGYITGGSDEFGEIALLYNSSGELVWGDTSCNCGSEIIYTTQIPDKRFLFLNLRGNVNIKDPIGKRDSILNLGFTNQAYIEKGFRNDSILYIIGNDRINNISGSVLIKLNLRTLNIISNEFDTINLGIRGFNQFHDGSLLKYYWDYKNYFIIKTSKNGYEVWKKFLYLKNTIISDILTMEDNSFLLAGYIRDSTGERRFDGLVFKMDSLGNSIWTKTYLARVQNSSKVKYKAFYRLRLLNPNEIILAGEDGEYPTGPWTQMSLLAIDSVGTIKWELTKRIKGEGNSAKDFVITNKEDLVAVGTCGSSDFGGPDRTYIIKIKPPVTKTINPDDFNFYIFPNPTNDILILNAQVDEFDAEISILNSLGEIIYTTNWQQQINLSSLTPGQYYVVLKSKNVSTIKKLTVIKG